MARSFNDLFLRPPPAQPLGREPFKQAGGPLSLARAKIAIEEGLGREDLGLGSKADLSRAIAWSLFQGDQPDALRALALVAGWPAVIDALESPLRPIPLAGQAPEHASSVGDLVWLRGRTRAAKLLSREGWMKEKGPAELASHILGACMKRLAFCDPWIPIDGMGTSLAVAVRNLRPAHAEQARDLWMQFAPAARWRCAPLAEALRERDWLPMSGPGSLDDLFPDGWDTPGLPKASLAFLKSQVGAMEPAPALAAKLALSRARRKVAQEPCFPCFLPN